MADICDKARLFVTNSVIEGGNGMRQQQKAVLAVLVMLAASLSGCTLFNPQTGPVEREGLTLKWATQTYAVTLETLADLREAGELDKDEIKRINEARVLVRAGLDTWREQWKQGADPDEQARAKVRRGLQVLLGVANEYEEVSNDN